MDALLIVALLVMGIAALTLAAWMVAARRNEDEQEARAMVRARLVAICRQRNEFYND